MEWLYTEQIFQSNGLSETYFNIPYFGAPRHNISFTQIVMNSYNRQSHQAKSILNIIIIRWCWFLLNIVSLLRTFIFRRTFEPSSGDLIIADFLPNHWKLVCRLLHFCMNNRLFYLFSLWVILCHRSNRKRVLHFSTEQCSCPQYYTNLLFKFLSMDSL